MFVDLLGDTPAVLVERNVEGVDISGQQERQCFSEKVHEVPSHLPGPACDEGYSPRLHAAQVLVSSGKLLQHFIENGPQQKPGSATCALPNLFLPTSRDVKGQIGSETIISRMQSAEIGKRM